MIRKSGKNRKSFRRKLCIILSIYLLWGGSQVRVLPGRISAERSSRLKCILERLVHWLVTDLSQSLNHQVDDRSSALDLIDISQGMDWRTCHSNLADHSSQDTLHSLGHLNALQCPHFEIFPSHFISQVGMVAPPKKGLLTTFGSTQSALCGQFPQIPNTIHHPKCTRAV